MQIPKRFKLYAQEIEVEIVKDLFDKQDDCGLADYRQNKIQLQCIATQPRPTTQQEQWFCHELVHFILYHAGYDKLRKDEDLVERVSLLLHQALSTAEYR